MGEKPKPRVRKPREPKYSGEDHTCDKQPGKLFYFDVDEDGTIIESDFKEPKINRELFDNIFVDRLTTPERILGEVEHCDALVEHFRGLARDEQQNLVHRIELRDYRDDKEHQQMKRLVEELEDEDEGWKEWIKTEGDDGTPRFKKLIVDWLAAPIEWTEDMPNNATGEGGAKQFFESEDLATLDELGVSIVEGDRPGSTYCAAELDKTVEEANQIAQKLGLFYRFRERSKNTA